MAKRWWCDLSATGTCSSARCDMGRYCQEALEVRPLIPPRDNIDYRIEAALDRALVRLGLDSHA